MQCTAKFCCELTGLLTAKDHDMQFDINIEHLYYHNTDSFKHVIQLISSNVI